MRVKKLAFLDAHACGLVALVGALGAAAVGCTFVVDGRIVASDCGNGVVEGSEACDDGDPNGTDGCSAQCEIAFPCSTAADCPTDDLCLGPASCEAVGADGATGCVWDNPMNCDDGDACTDDGCLSASGTCVHALIDADGDLHAPTSLGACGTDCDDTDPEVNPDYPEVCGDGKDNNCSGDETDAPAFTTWYGDCDGDGFAAVGADTVDNCGLPTSEPPSCPTVAAPVSTWTPREPVDASTTDCADLAPNAHPNQRDWFDSMVNIEGGYDYDCSTVEELRWEDLNPCNASLNNCLKCLTPTCQDDPCSCGLGWVNTIPACGVEGTWRTCGDGSDGCPFTVPLVQECH